MTILQYREILRSNNKEDKYLRALERLNFAGVKINNTKAKGIAKMVLDGKELQDIINITIDFDAIIKLSNINKFKGTKR